jgi:hypothetical protein
MERLVELADRAGQAERVAELRRRKSEVERGKEHYALLLWRQPAPSGVDDWLALARAAETAGRLLESRALYAWAQRLGSDASDARDALTRLDREILARRVARLGDEEFWRVSAASPRSGQTGRPSRILGRFHFKDDARSASLKFIYHNPETPFHHLPEPFGGGLALLDYDGDGWLDVYCADGGPYTSTPQPRSPGDFIGDRLFRNRGDGTFEDVTERSGIGHLHRAHGHGVAVGDVDGDGRPDLFLTRWRSYALYHNRGDGTFEDSTARWGLEGDRNWPTSAALADLDGDGDLDLYVCHYAAWDFENPRLCHDSKSGAYFNCNPLDVEALSDHLFRNDGGRFVDVTTQAGITDRGGRGLGVVAADLDDDGRVDLFVSNDSSQNYFLRNLGGMRFEEAAHVVGVAGNASGSYQAGMGVASGDLDGDGRIDIAVTNFYGESTTFYRNLGGGSFCDATTEVGLAVATRRLLGFGVAFLDADNDGSLDLVSANGHVNDVRPNYPHPMPAQLLAGEAGRLIDVSSQAGEAWRILHMGRGLAVGDLDNDGRQDVLILSLNEPLAYLHNRSSAGRFLLLQLEGLGANRDAVGAKVEVITRNGRQVAQRVGGGSYQSASDPRLHFGLGAIERIERLEIRWPSGRCERFHDLPLDAGYLIREGSGRAVLLKGFERNRPARATSSASK